MRTIGEITLDSPFGQALAEIARGRSVLEIGTGPGIGSTLCLLSTARFLITVEASQEQYSHNFSLGDRLNEVRLCGLVSRGIKPYWHPENRIQDKETWQYEFSLAAKQFVLLHFSPFSVLLLDGGEFTSDADFLTLWQRPEIIALDDTNPAKSVKNCYGRECLIKAGWTVLRDELNDRNGWFIARRPE